MQSTRPTCPKCSPSKYPASLEFQPSSPLQHCLPPVMTRRHFWSLKMQCTGACNVVLERHAYRLYPFFAIDQSCGSLNLSWKLAAHLAFCIRSSTIWPVIGANLASKRPLSEDSELAQWRCDFGPVVCPMFRQIKGRLISCTAVTLCQLHGLDF